MNKARPSAGVAEPFDWGGLALVAMLVGVMLTFCGVLRFFPAFDGMTYPFAAEPVLTGKQTLALGAGLLAGGAIVFARYAKLSDRSRK